VCIQNPHEWIYVCTIVNRAYFVHFVTLFSPRAGPLPNQIQVIIELFSKKKPLEGDVPGLLSLIMFAGRLGPNKEAYSKTKSSSISIFLKPQVHHTAGGKFGKYVG
jgi:hypothetical protein